MGGVIWHKPCLLTNFQSISFFPVLLETKGFLPALPQKFSHLNTLKVVDRDFMLAIRTYQKAAAAAQLVNCAKGGVQNYINTTSQRT